MSAPILTPVSPNGQSFECGVCATSRTAAAAYRIRTAPPDLRLLACPDCGSLQFTPAPDLDYHVHTDDRRQIEAYVETGAGLETIFGFIANAASRRAQARFLDVGAGYGFGVDIARHAFGWDSVGIEPSTYGRVGAADLGLPILPGLLTADGPLAGQRFDVVHASEVIEHLPDPHAFLALLVSSLAPDGILVFSTPMAEAVTNPGLPELHKLALLSPGAHVRLFSRKALLLLLQAQGLRHVEITELPGTYVCTASPVPLPPRDAAAAGEEVFRRYLDRQLSRHAGMPLLRRAFGNRLYAHLVHRNRIEEAQALWPRIGVTLPAGIPQATTPEAFHDLVPPSVPHLAFLRGMALLLRGAGDRAIMDEAVRHFRLAHALARRKIALMPNQAMLEATFLWLATLHEAIAQRQADDRAAAASVARSILADTGDGLVPAPDDGIRARAGSLLADLAA